MSKQIWRFFNKEYLITYGAAGLLVIVGFWVAYQFVRPAPPDKIVISTGSEDGAYYHFAQRYRDILAGSGIVLEIRTSAGSLENISRLRTTEDAVDVAFVQGGTNPSGDSNDLVSLGSLYYEPLWVFYRAALNMSRLTDLLGKKIAVGMPGSGTRAVALRLLKDNGVTRPPTVISDLGGQGAIDALLAGQLDAVFLIVSPTAPIIQTLPRTGAAKLMGFERATAYVRIYPFLSKIVLPEGVLDLERNLPSEEKVLVAPTANLVARKEVHPALIGMLLQAATEVHGSGGMFEKRGEFPAPRYLEFPLSKEAERYYRRGPPLLQRYLPFWAATFIDRMIIMLVPFVALLLPLSRMVPPAYKWRVRRSIYYWYKDLKAVDAELGEGRSAEQLLRCEREIDRIESEVNKVSTPLAYSDQLYNLRVHIELIRRKLDEARRNLTESV